MKNLQMPQNLIKKWEKLGFVRNNFRLVFLAPLLQTAWAEGFLQAGERRAIENFAVLEFGIEPDTSEYSELKFWLDERPADDLFEKMNQILNEWLDAMQVNTRKRWRNRLLQACLDVAHSSPRIGFAARKLSNVCPDEKREIMQISRRLGFMPTA